MYEIYVMLNNHVLVSRSVLDPADGVLTQREEAILMHVWATLLLIQERPKLAPLLDSRAPEVKPGESCCRLNAPPAIALSKRRHVSFYDYINFCATPPSQPTPTTMFHGRI